MSKKTIWPNWRNDRLPVKKDSLIGVVLIYTQNKIITRLWEEVSLGDYWFDARITFPHSNERYIDFVATPEECEARKKELSGVSMGTVMHIDDPTDYILNNGWIPGNKPEKGMLYEITMENGNVSIAEYFKTIKVWGSLYFGEETNRNVVAYRPFALSAPYQPPEPEREFLCPFCKSDDCSVDSDDGFGCDGCYARLQELKDEASVFEMYGKLNPKKEEEMSRKSDAVIQKIEAMIKETEGIVFVEEKMVPSSHSIKVRTKALKDVIRVIEDYVEEANTNNEAYKKGELR